jgi:two-component system, chemotaxis family, protein-glutamate methylesterase/glutaminase
MSAETIHVLVVDDSAVVRQTITSFLHSQQDITTSIAADPLIAMEKMKRHRPDVIVLDLEMPRMDGLTFLRKVMAEDPIPVIVCSGHVGTGNEQAMLALESGAVELIAKPKVGVQAFLNETAVSIVDTIRAASAYRMPGRRKVARIRRPDAAARPRRPAGPSLIAIGASTGGPEALREILPALPVTTPGIVIVQHMAELFTGSFARHLDQVCAIDVIEARAGDEVVPGRALIAPGNRHMSVYEFAGRYFVDVVDGPLVSRHRPSVDVLFHSVARCAGAGAIGVILTGMGNDGAEGLREMKLAGAFTVAQDETSCAVFGMPREAVRNGAVCDSAHVSRIAGILRECVAITELTAASGPARTRPAS